MLPIGKDQKVILMIIAEYNKNMIRKNYSLLVLKKISNWKTLLKELINMRLVSINGDNLELTVYGWSLVCSIASDIIKRRKKEYNPGKVL